MPKKSLWQEHRAKALATTSISAEDLEEALELLERYVTLDLDSFEKDWMDPDFAPLEGEELAQAKTISKNVSTGVYPVKVDRSGTPLPKGGNEKIQVTVADGTWDLLNNWAAAENRGLSEVANAAIQAGLRVLRADGSIPKAALDAYERQSERRIAAAQARRVVSSFINDHIEVLF